MPAVALSLRPLADGACLCSLFRGAETTLRAGRGRCPGVGHPPGRPTNMNFSFGFSHRNRLGRK
eukprot:9159626-Pyramimonas_sp.AAC.1